MPADNRTLNYDKNFTEGDQKRCELSEFNSDNTRRLNVEETKAKIASLEYIQNELRGIDNIAKYSRILINKVSGCTSGRDTLAVSMSNCGAIPPSASKEVAPEPVEGRYFRTLQNVKVV